MPIKPPKQKIKLQKPIETQSKYKVPRKHARELSMADVLPDSIKKMQSDYKRKVDNRLTIMDVFEYAVRCWDYDNKQKVKITHSMPWQIVKYLGVSDFLVLR
jgi:hypothetical protein